MVILIIALIGAFVCGRVYEARNAEQTSVMLQGGPGINGFFGVYNSTTPNYYDGQSAAASLDNRGRVYVSPSSTLTIIGP